MADQTTTQPETTKNRIFEIAWKALLLGVSGVELFTIYKTVSKKLGWF